MPKRARCALLGEQTSFLFQPNLQEGSPHMFYYLTAFAFLLLELEARVHCTSEVVTVLAYIEEIQEKIRG